MQSFKNYVRRLAYQDTEKEIQIPDSCVVRPARKKIHKNEHPSWQKLQTNPEHNK